MLQNKRCMKTDGFLYLQTFSLQAHSKKDVWKQEMAAEDREINRQDLETLQVSTNFHQIILAVVMQ